MAQGQGYFRRADDIMLRSGLEQYRESTVPTELDGERVLRWCQGALDSGNPFVSMWKPGYLYLTARRLLFFQGGKKVYEIVLRSLEEIVIIQRDWIPGSQVTQLRLKERARGRVSYLWMKRPQPWKEAVEQLWKEETEDGAGHRD